MSIELPNAGEGQLTPVPDTIKKDNPEVYAYLVSLRNNIEETQRGLFENDLRIANTINLGTSGTFTISSGDSIIVTSGIVITVTS